MYSDAEAERRAEAQRLLDEQEDGLQWWEIHDNLVLVAQYMAKTGLYSAEDMAYFVEKPWKFQAQLLEAQGEQRLLQLTPEGFVDPDVEPGKQSAEHLYDKADWVDMEENG